jgi:hypothetical protein
MDPTVLILSILAIVFGAMYIIYFLNNGQKPKVEAPAEKVAKKKEEKKEPVKAEAKVKVERELEHENLEATLRGGKDSPKVGSIISLATSTRYLVQVRDNDPNIRLWRCDTLFQSDKK